MSAIKSQLRLTSAVVKQLSKLNKIESMFGKKCRIILRAVLRVKTLPSTTLKFTIHYGNLQSLFDDSGITIIKKRKNISAILEGNNSQFYRKQG